jgi:hypothetical protein
MYVSVVSGKEVLQSDSPQDEGRDCPVESLVTDEEHLNHIAFTIPKATKHAMSTTDAPATNPVIIATLNCFFSHAMRFFFADAICFAVAIDFS